MSDDLMSLPDQQSLHDQIVSAINACNAAGLYDAVDWIRERYFHPDHTNSDNAILLEALETIAKPLDYYWVPLVKIAREALAKVKEHKNHGTHPRT